MSYLRNTPLYKNPKQNSVHPRYSSNPFEYDDNISSIDKTNPFDDGDEAPRNSSYSNNLEKNNNYKNGFRNSGGLENQAVQGLEAPRKSTYSYNLEKINNYKNGFRKSGGLENQTVEELENYSVYKAEKTTKNVNNCLKIAEDIRGEATKTLVVLHQQGEQIYKTHSVAADIDIDLSRGEKLLGSLGGLFSKTWRPTKTRTITGPVITRDDPVQRKGNHLEQRERLGLNVAPKERRNIRTTSTEPTTALQKVELEKEKQDDTLSDLSNLLDELKEMAVDMGSEIDRQNKALDPFMDEVEELNFRVRGANQRGRRLLGK